jgi:hypothetical protein
METSLLLDKKKSSSYGVLFRKVEVIQNQDAIHKIQKSLTLIGRIQQSWLPAHLIKQSFFGLCYSLHH